MLLTVRWGQLKPSQPSRRVARWGQIRPSQRHPAASQVGPLQAALPGPNQVVTAKSARELLLTLPPMREWPEDTLRAMYEVPAFVEIRKSF